MTVETPAFAPGTLVHVRGRDWVVFPSREEDVLRPLAGGGSAWSWTDLAKKSEKGLMPRST